jgi:hypothetical protein
MPFDPEDEGLLSMGAGDWSIDVLESGLLGSVALPSFLFGGTLVTHNRTG